MKIILVLMILCLLSVSVVSAADNNTQDTVVAVATDDGTFTALRQKINDAVNGSTLYLENDYEQDGYSDIIIGKNLTIDGKGHTIDAYQKSRIFNIGSGMSVTIKNITFTNGKVSGFYPNSCGGAIFIESNSSVTISDSTFTNCKSISEYGGGGAIYSSSSLSVINSVFINTNSMNVGGAIYSQGNVTVISSDFKDISTYYDGGAICVFGNIIIFDSRFINTTSEQQGGGAIFGTDNITVTNSTFANTQAGYGGAIYTQSGSVTVTNSTFTNSKAIGEYGSGGAIRGNNVNVICSSFINNTASDYGGASIKSWVLNVKDSIFISKNAIGRAIIDCSVVNLTNNTIESNILAIYQHAGNIISQTYLIFDNVTTTFDKEAKLIATLKDDKNNTIGSSNYIYPMINHEYITNAMEFNKTTNTFNGLYTEYNKGKYVISGGYDYAADCRVIEGVLTVNGYNSIVGNNVTKYYRNDTQFVAKLFDKKGNKLAEGTTVKININGVDYTRSVRADGSIQFNINLNPGEYVLTVTNPVTFEIDSFNITVLPTIESNNLVKYYRNGSQFVVKLLDLQGNHVSGKTVTFNINGVFYTRTSDANGNAKLNINLQPAEYIITSDYNGCKVSNTVKVLSTIESANLVKYYRNGSQFVVKLLDAHGNPASGKSVTFNINGVFYTRTSDANGNAKLNINLQPAEYIITCEYEGLMQSNTVRVLSTIKSKDIEMTVSSRIPFVVTALDGQGNPASGKYLSFNINGVMYSRITDANGNAKLNINLMAGQYIITTEYEGLKQSNTIIIWG